MIPLPFDKLDYQILRCLNENARMSAADMEARTNADQRTIRKRLARLLDLGAIRLRGVIEPKVFGYGISVDVLLFIDNGDEDAIIRKLSGMAPISYIATGHETNELSIEARFQDFESMEDFLKRELPSIEGLTISRSALVPRIVKNIDDWLPPMEFLDDCAPPSSSTPGGENTG